VIRLVLGGAGSGKSAYALELFLEGPGPNLFVATGKPGDLDFRAQILDHRMARPPETPVLEVDLDLAGPLSRTRAASVLVDSLDFWLFNRMGRDSGADPRELAKELARGLAGFAGRELVIVSSEISLGPIAIDPRVRRFVRALGGLHQETARICDEVVLVAAGCPLYLKRG